MKGPSRYIALFFLILLGISQLAYPLHILGSDHALGTENKDAPVRIIDSGDHPATQYSQEISADNYCDCLICLQSRNTTVLAQQLPYSIPVSVTSPTVQKCTNRPALFLSTHHPGGNSLRAPPVSV